MTAPVTPSPVGLPQAPASTPAGRAGSHSNQASAAVCLLLVLGWPGVIPAAAPAALRSAAIERFDVEVRYGSEETADVTADARVRWPAGDPGAGGTALDHVVLTDGAALESVSVTRPADADAIHSSATPRLASESGSRDRVHLFVTCEPDGPPMGHRAAGEAGSRAGEDDVVCGYRLQYRIRAIDRARVALPWLRVPLESGMRLRVVLAPGVEPGDQFPRLRDWRQGPDGWTGSAALPGVPAFVRVTAAGAPGAGRGRVLDVALLVAAFVAIGLSLVPPGRTVRSDE